MIAGKRRSEARAGSLLIGSRCGLAMFLLQNCAVVGIVHGGDREPNDTLVTASAIPLDGFGSAVIDGAFLGDGEWGALDVDIYSFEIGPLLSPPVLVIADMTANGSPLDGYLRILDAFGAELANNDDRDFTDHDPRLETYLLGTGIHYVAVSAGRNPRYDVNSGGSGMSGSVGAYRLTVTTESATFPIASFESNDAVDSAVPMGTTSFTVTDQFIGDGEFGRLDVDFYLLTLAFPARIDVQVRAASIGSALDPLVLLRTCADPVARPLFGDQCALGGNDDGPDGSADSRLSVGVPQASPLYIMVSGSTNREYDPTVAGSGEPGSLGPYELVVNVTYLVGNAIEEPNDSILTSTPVALGDPLGSAVIEMSGFVGDGPYALTRGDRDFFALELFGDGIILAVDVEASTIGSELDPVIAVYDAFGRRMAVNDNRGSSTDAHLTIPVPCAAVTELPGSLFVLVMGTKQRWPNDPFVPWPGANRLEEFSVGDGPGSIGPYHITFTALPSGETCGVEPDDTLASATNTGIVDEGSYLCTDGMVGDATCGDRWADVDMWSFEVRHAPATVRATVAGCPSEFRSRCVLRVFDSDANVVPSSSFMGSGEFQSLLARLPRAGTYFLALSGDYQFDPQDACQGPGLGCNGPYQIAILLSQGTEIGSASLAASTQPNVPEDETTIFATRLDEASNRIDAFNADTGELMTSVAAPEPRFGGAGGLAYDGTILYYVGTGRYPMLYLLDPGTGRVLGGFVLWQGSGFYSDAAMLGGELYLLDVHEQMLHVLDPLSARSLRSMRIRSPHEITIGGGLAALAGPGRLYVADAFDTGNIYEVHPQTGAMTNTLSGMENRPIALAGAGSSLLYVAQWRSDVMELVNRTGEFVDSLVLPSPAGSLAGAAAIPPFADFDQDGDVDLVDYAFFQACRSETGQLGDAICAAGDGDDNGRVDLADFGAYPDALTGP